jgi:hypothetical protein
MDATQFLFLDPLGKYVLELIIALLATLANKMTDWSLKGKELFFEAPQIATGAVNWTMCTVGIALAIPPYYGSFNKLVVMASVLVVFIMVVAGCWRVVGMGQSWRGSKGFAGLAMYGGPLTIAILSLIIFISVDAIK